MVRLVRMVLFINLWKSNYMISPIIIDTMVKNNGAIIEYFGDTPKIRFLDFLIGNHFFDFNMTDIAKESKISYNSLLVFFKDFVDKGIIINTRRVGKSEMYKLNMENSIAINFLKFAWFLTKQDLKIEGGNVVLANKIHSTKH